jgi:hypothetical protein
VPLSAMLRASYPDKLRAFFDRCRALGCDPQLRRRFVLYVNDPTGARMNVGTIGKDGNVEIWGTASHDQRLGEPIGRKYMERVSSFLPEARIKDDFADPGNWHIRHYGRTARALREMLAHEEDWLSAIQELIERFRAIERAEERETTSEH